MLIKFIFSANFYTEFLSVVTFHVIEKYYCMQEMKINVVCCPIISDHTMKMNGFENKILNGI